MAIQKEKFYTETEYENFENDGICEYSNGFIIAMAPPTRIHQKVSGEISRIIGNYLSGKPCEIYQAPFEVRLELHDGIKRLQPDISVICDKSKLTPKGCTGAPDLIIEIASPSYILYDYVTKASWYRDAGVREYWIVNPMTSKITVFNYELETMEEFSFVDILRVGIFKDLEIDFGKIDLS